MRSSCIFVVRRQIAAQTNLFMLAGYETTAVAITYCIYLVSKHPQVQQKLLQEVEKFKGKSTYDQLDQFPYAAAVISEALRVLPPGSVTSRQATTDAQVRLSSSSPLGSFPMVGKKQ